MNRIFRTVNFKLTAFYAGLFSLSVLILGIVVFYSIRASVEHQIKTQIELDASQLMGDYRDDGLDELRHDIHERIEADPANRLLYSIQSPDGRIIFDKIGALPFSGWHSIHFGGKNFLLYVLDLKDGYRFGVASDMEKFLNLQKTVRNAFAAAFFFSLILGTAGGWLLTRRFLSRIDTFNRIAEDIGQEGALGKRLPVEGSGDDFDQMAGTVNLMLERIEQLVQDVRRVTTNIAHDLRTPLGRIRQKLEALQEYSKQDLKSKQLLEESLFLLDETLQTFSSLLHLAEIESGNLRNRFVRLPLHQLLGDLFATYRSVAEEHGVTLHYSPHAQTECVIQGDRRLLAQLWVNLIENAIRHTPKGSQIHLHLRCKENQAEVSLSDNGPGIPSEEWSNVLKPFYRLEPSRNSPGNGLGLSFVAAIAKLHHARFYFEDNRPGLKAVLTFPLG